MKIRMGRGAEFPQVPWILDRKREGYVNVKGEYQSTLQNIYHHSRKKSIALVLGQQRLNVIEVNLCIGTRIIYMGWGIDC